MTTPKAKAPRRARVPAAVNPQPPRTPDDPPLAPTETMPGRRGGTLRVGNPGNRGNRTTAALREALRRDLLEQASARVHVLTDMADGAVYVELRERCAQCGHVPQQANGTPVVELLKHAPTPSDQRAAIEAMLKYGAGVQKENITVDQMRDLLRIVRSIIRRRVPREAEAILAELRAAMSEA